MRIDLEKLFYLVHEHFNNTAEYRKAHLEYWRKQNAFFGRHNFKHGKSNPLYPDLLDKDDARRYTRLFQRYESGEWWVWEFCEVLGFDRGKLYGLVRGIRQWYERGNWQYCFFTAHKDKDKIFDYLRKGWG